MCAAHSPGEKGEPCEVAAVGAAQSLSCVKLFATLWTWPARLLCPWDSPGKNTGVGSHFCFQVIFPTQGSNLGLLHCRQSPA